MHSFLWLAQLAYTADILSILKSLNLALQGKDDTVFNIQDKLKAVQTKNCSTAASTTKNFSFTTSTDFLLMSTKEIHGVIAEDLKYI
jgi:hypothetical protein